MTWSNPLFLNAFVGILLLSLICSGVGAVNFVRRQSLTTEVIAHAVFPGLCLAYLLQDSNNYLLIIGSGLITSFIAMGLLEQMVRHPKLDKHTAVAINLSLFFALGGVISSIQSRYFDGNSMNMGTFLNGNAIGIDTNDMILLASIAFVSLSGYILFQTRLQVYTFDPLALKNSERIFIRFILNAFTIITVVLGIQAVGLILVSALIITPAAISHLITRRFNQFFLISLIAGMSLSTIGFLIAYHYNLSAGPVIVLSLSTVLVLLIRFSNQQQS